MTTPKRNHPFKTGDGNTREYLWITDVHCKICDPYGDYDDRVAGVILDDTGSNTLVTECLNCAAEEHHRSDEFKFNNPPPASYVPTAPGL